MSNYTRNDVSTISGVNAELEKVSVAIADHLDRSPSGGQTNQMEADLDMNSNRILNAILDVKGIDLSDNLDMGGYSILNCNSFYLKDGLVSLTGVNEYNFSEFKPDTEYKFIFENGISTTMKPTGLRLFNSSETQETVVTDASVVTGTVYAVTFDGADIDVDEVVATEGVIDSLGAKLIRVINTNADNQAIIAPEEMSLIHDGSSSSVSLRHNALGTKLSNIVDDKVVKLSDRLITVEDPALTEVSTLNAYRLQITNDDSTAILDASSGGLSYLDVDEVYASDGYISNLSNTVGTNSYSLSANGLTLSSDGNVIVIADGAIGCDALDVSVDFSCYAYSIFYDQVEFNEDAIFNDVLYSNGIGFGLEALNYAFVSETTMLMTIGTLDPVNPYVAIEFEGADGVGNAVTAGSIVINNGTSTAYNTSSDPRLKDFKPYPSDSEIDGKFNALKDSFAVFDWKNGSDTNVWGFDAHKAIDNGLDMGTEGYGSRELEIGEVLEPEEFKMVKQKPIDGVEQPDKKVITKPAVVVTPASVDQSKAVPILLAKIAQLEEVLKANGLL